MRIKKSHNTIIKTTKVKQLISWKEISSIYTHDQQTHESELDLTRRTANQNHSEVPLPPHSVG
jgi:hypothetical protein